MQAHELENRYYTLDDLVEEPSIYAKSVAFRRLKEDSELRHKVSVVLGELGFHRFSYLNESDEGVAACIFRTVDNQIIRIADTMIEFDRIHHPAILQPIKSFDETFEPDNLRVEILPQIHHFDVGEEQYEKLSTLFDKDKLVLSRDFACRGNCGLLEDGTPIILDAGTITDIYHSDHDAIKPEDRYDSAKEDFSDPKYDD